MNLVLNYSSLARARDFLLNIPIRIAHSAICNFMNEPDLLLGRNTVSIHPTIDILDGVLAERSEVCLAKALLF